MAMPQKRGEYSYSDYLALDGDVRYEVIDGQIYNMTPAPTPQHQDVLSELITEFRLYLRGKDCRAFVSPIDVCLSEERDDLSKVEEWVEPDLVVVCDKSKIGVKRIIGTPDLVVEVLSPSTAKKDKLIKFNRYQRAGVKEYWIVDPVNQVIEVYLLDGEIFKRSGVYVKGDNLPVYIFEDFNIDLNIVFRSNEGGS